MIIGVTGTNGAGKGTVVDYLIQKGFVHYSARDLWNEEIARRGMTSNRDSMTLVANDLRAQHGADYFARTALARAQQNGGDAIIESLRSVGEAEYLKSQGALIWAVDADIHTRYERAAKRGSETDQVSFEEFKAHEVREMTNVDPAKQNIAGVMNMADHTFINNGALEELNAEVETVLKQVRK